MSQEKCFPTMAFAQKVQKMFDIISIYLSKSSAIFS